MDLKDAEVLLEELECRQRFAAGELGDAADIMEWVGPYDNVLLRERSETLGTAPEA